MRSGLRRRFTLLCGLAALGTSWFVTSGFGPVEHDGPTVSPSAHPDEDIVAARQAVVTFAYAAAVADGEAAATVLHDELTTSWGATKKNVVAQVARALPWGGMRFELRYASFEKVGDRIRVTPVILYGFTNRSAYTFELVKKEKQWLIVRVEMGAETPLELQEADQRNPEHHILHPITRP